MAYQRHAKTIAFIRKYFTHMVEKNVIPIENQKQIKKSSNPP